MKMTGNTILITGGSSGIGLELARQLCAENTVVITGRDAQKLDSARATLGSVHTLQSDVSDLQATVALRDRIVREFPALNMLVNNAGMMRKVNLRDGIDFEVVDREVETNLSGPIRLVKLFVPHLERQPSAAIVNVTSGLAFVPFPISPVYSATKAGLHAFTLALRVQMSTTGVKIFELAPPGTETRLFRGDFDATDLGSVKGMAVTKLARLAIEGLSKDVLEIRPGLSNVLKLLSRVAPKFALDMFAKGNAASLARMQAQLKT